MNFANDERSNGVHCVDLEYSGLHGWHQHGVQSTQRFQCIKTRRPFRAYHLFVCFTLGGAMRKRRAKTVSYVTSPCDLFRAFLTERPFRTFHSEARCATHRFRIGHMWYTVITRGDVAVAGSQRSSVHGPLHVREAGQMNGVCV